MPVVPKNFEVWTILVGLPLPEQLTQNFQALAQQIIERLPVNTRLYKVLPENYHWELFIIKRPDEDVDRDSLQKVPDILQPILHTHTPFTLSYRGFLITPDGTIIVRGYGNFDELRTQLLRAIPWASAQQSRLGHVSLGRILDPVGQECFTELKNLVKISQNNFYGELEVGAIQYIHETQWYMEQRELVATLHFQV